MHTVSKHVGECGNYPPTLAGLDGGFWTEVFAAEAVQPKS